MRPILILLLIGCLSSCAKTTNDLSYVVSPGESQNGEATLKIEMTFQANPEGRSLLLLQDTAWGQDSLYNVIESVRLVNAKGSILKKRDSNYIEIVHPKNLKKVVFEYVLKQDTEGELTTMKTYRPVIQPNYFHVFSHNLFMLPFDIVEDKKEGFDIAIEWKGFPGHYNFQNSFGSNSRKQRIEGIIEQKFHSAVFLGGDFRVYSRKVKNNEVSFAVRGDWEVFDDSTMTRILEQTVTVQRDFWKDHSQEYFSVSMIPTILERGSSFQGSGLTNSFATSASNNEYLEVEGLVYLFNHELMHNWTGHIIKNENEEEQYWFSEGFTEYYTFKNIAKNKIYGLGGNYFIKKLNETQRLLYESPVKNAKNEEINYTNFWSSRDYGKLPYYRGALFAFYLDQSIRETSNGKLSLDDMMLEIKEAAVTNGQKLSHDYFLKTASNYLGDDIGILFDKHILKGEDLRILDLYKNLDLEFDTTSKIFDLGFEFSDDKKNIASIDKLSKAYEAGLRKGDRLTSRSYRYDPNFKAEFIRVSGDKEEKIEFYPAKEVALPNLLPTAGNLNKLGF